MSKWGRGPAVVMLWMGLEKKLVKAEHLYMREAASSGEVPDVGPPNTKEQEAALRPMCAQLKVK